MQTRMMKPAMIGRIAAIASLMLAGMIVGTAAKAQAPAGAVFTSTNAPIGNSVVMFNRSVSGALTPVGQFFTGGMGTGTGLGNAGAVILSPNKQWLFTVNAGSNDISVFAVGPYSLRLVDLVPSGGTRPVSLAAYGDRLYVAHDGTPNNITGFSIGRRGNLTPISGSTQSLSGATVHPAQIKFSPYGDYLVVTEQNTDKIDVFPVDENGIAGPAIVTPSLGAHPFGFDFDPAGHLMISEATNSSASSYFASTFGTLPISGPVVNGQKAACWLVSSADGKYAYTANAASDDISGYWVAKNGKLNLIDQNAGVAATLAAGFHPTDMAVDGRGHLYVLGAFTGGITALGINRDGTLQTIGSTANYGANMTGIAAK